MSTMPETIWSNCIFLSKVSAMSTPSNYLEIMKCGNTSWSVQESHTWHGQVSCEDRIKLLLTCFQCTDAIVTVDPLPVDHVTVCTMVTKTIWYLYIYIIFIFILYIYILYLYLYYFPLVYAVSETHILSHCNTILRYRLFQS